jgi:ribonuclease T2
MKHVVIGLALLAVPQILSAQTLQCTAPSGPQSIRPDLPSQSQPTRILPIGGYTLAITWSPQYCRDAKGDSSFQCGGANRFGFTLHGLWPDGVGKDWPQYCRPTAILPRAVVRRHICTTPSAQLMQHEWAKHGTCMARYSPASYFERSNALYYGLRFPDMDGLSRRNLLTAGDLATAFAAANRGMTADMMRVTATREGWLDEIWICLNKAFRPARCPAHQGGLSSNAPLKIWRGSR